MGVRPASATCLLDPARLPVDLNTLARTLAEAMNTPLGTISAHAEEALWLLEHRPHGKAAALKAEELQEHLRLIMQESRRCSRMATSLMQMFQPTGKAEQTVALGSILPSVTCGETPGVNP
jgi:signal transduction histidine kinase